MYNMILKSYTYSAIAMASASASLILASSAALALAFESSFPSFAYQVRSLPVDNCE